MCHEFVGISSSQSRAGAAMVYGINTIRDSLRDHLEPYRTRQMNESPREHYERVKTLRQGLAVYSVVVGFAAFFGVNFVQRSAGIPFALLGIFAAVLLIKQDLAASKVGAPALYKYSKHMITSVV